MERKNNSNTPQIVEDIMQRIVDINPQGFILRPDLQKQTFGILHGRTEANRDSLKVGMVGRFKISRKMAYPLDSVLKRVREKIEIIQ